MSETPREAADRIARNVHLVRNSPYIQFEPTDLQWAFLCDDRPEILFAGGTGGGKSWALLAGALMYVHVPNYAAVIFRKTFPDLMMPSGLIPLAASWLTNTDAQKHDGGKKWSFPSGATLTFAHLENPNDRFKYAGLEAQYTGWDEIAQMEEECYTFLQSRMRRSVTVSPELASVPMRTRATANPGHRNAKWVKNHWISDDEGKPLPRNPDRMHIASTLDDNPHLDREDYAARLEKLGPVERAQMRHGDWNISAQGTMFQADSFIRVPGRTEGGGAYRIRMWDLAGSAKKASDFCAGVLVARSKTTGIYRVEHVVHEKLEPGPLDRKMKQTAELDGKAVHIGLEEEKSGSGKLVSAHFRKLLQGYVVRPMRPTGDKVERAGLASSLVDQNMVELTIAPWNEKFISECVGFGPNAAHDDMVDAFAYACHHLSRLPVQNQKKSDEEAPAVEREGGVPRGGACFEILEFSGRPNARFWWHGSAQPVGRAVDAQSDRRQPAMEIVMPPEQRPCDWCLGDRPSLLLCRCVFACGEPDCPCDEENRYRVQSVPTFPCSTDMPIEPIRTPVINDAVNIEPDDYEKAILRVVELHSKCPCPACSNGANRQVCTSCNAFWPCPTIHALRDMRFGIVDALEVIAGA